MMAPSLKTSNFFPPFFQYRNICFHWSVFVLVILCLLPIARYPVFLQDFWFSKWAIVYGAMITACLTAFATPRIYLPKLSWSLSGIFFSIFVWFFISCFLNHISPLGIPLLDRLGFVILTLLFFNLFFQKIIQIKTVLWFLSFSSVLYLVISLKEVVFCLLFHGSHNLLSTTFGNVNMGAEFVAGALIGQLALLTWPHDKKQSWALKAIIFASSLYCYLSLSRSIYLIFIVCFITFFCLGLLKKYPPLYHGFFLILLASLTCEFWHFLGDYLSQKPLNYVDALGKSSSTSARSLLLQATLSLIQDHPLGVGPGQFEFALIPYFTQLYPTYHENLIARSPHNEFLRFLAEDGLPYILLCLSFLVLLLKQHWRRIKDLVLKNALISGYGVFLGIQSLFQFPFQNSFPFFITTIVMGYFLAEIYASDVLCLTKTHPMKILKNSTLLLFILLANVILISEYLSFNYPASPFLNQIAYRLNPGNWVSALNIAYTEIDLGNNAAANKILEEELSQRPYNFFALSLYAYHKFDQKDKATACTILQKIDRFFNNQSQHHEFIRQHC
jgi:O-antigen ligase